ncbi:MAG TPA: IS630 family transposase [Terracidiphilus sp.]|nr:IS630 family transposase [Terracidiphilus sp.]
MFVAAAALTIDEGQKRQLESLLRTGATPQKIVRRCQVILLASQGVANHSIALQTGLSRPTVLATRAAFAQQGTAGICAPQKRNRSRRILTPELEQMILDTTLKTRPAGATHWSTRVLAAKLGVSRMMVERVWQRYDVQPHRVQKFKISNDPNFEDKVRDVVGLYLDPPERALVLCVDEKSQTGVPGKRSLLAGVEIQALDRTAPILPLRPGLPERQTYDYKRHGTTTLFAAFNILNGKVIGSCLPRHRGKEFIKFLNQLEKQVPPELDIHLILDNYSTHKSAEVQRWLKPKKRRRFHFHFTPTSSSWLHQVERWFGLITDKMIRRGTFRSTEELERAIYAWLATCNDTPKAFVWKATADVILDKVRRCKELAGTVH